jgi:flagellar protein FliS
VSTPTAYTAAYSRSLRENTILSASPAGLIVALYDGARRFLTDGSQAMRAREIERSHRALRRAEMIIDYLNQIIDDEQGEVAQTLHSLYAFARRHLNSARISLDAEKVDEVIRVLEPLREAFNQVARQ